MIRVVEAKFLTSCSSKDNIISEGISEVAFLGRSNVGKSSFINALVNRKNLAKSSSTPGKTRLINFFDIVYKKEDERYLARFVDLPGYGYAKVSKSLQEEWRKNLDFFLKNRVSIRIFVYIRDARHPKQKIDMEAMEYLKGIKREDQSILEVFTKTDKLNQKELSKIKKEFKNAIFVSNLKKRGVDEANAKIFELLFG